MNARFSAPANLLVAGEYAVTIEGGKGLAAAVEPRGIVTVEQRSSADRPRVVSIMRAPERDGGRETTDNPFVSSVLAEIASHTGTPLPDGTVITVDTSPFFDGNGRKRGLGSSAVTAVLLSAAALYAAGTSIEHANHEFQAAVHALATRAHRAANGGHGSGYDVAATVYGGWGLFTGGVNPSWESITAADAPQPLITRARLFTRPGPDAVVTSGAVRRFDRWRDHPDASSQITDLSKSVVALVASRTERELRAAWEQSAAAGRRIGAAIGVPAAVQIPRGALAKASGAGDEHIILAEFDPGRRWPLPWTRVRVEKDGVRRDG